MIRFKDTMAGKTKALPGELLELKQKIKVIMAQNPTSSDKELIKVVADDYQQYSRRNIRKLFNDIREERAEYIENVEAPKVVSETIGLLQALETYLLDMVVDDTLPAGVRAYCAMNTSLIRKQMISVMIDTGLLEEAVKPIIVDGLDLDSIFKGKERGDPSIMSSYTKLIDSIFIKAGLKPKNEVRRSDDTTPKSLKSG